MLKYPMQKKYSHLPMPPYRYLPGQNNHPEREGYLKNNKPKVGEFDLNSPLKNELFLYSIDLFNQQYFWECHVYLEILWNHLGRKGAMADYLKGWIKICAGFVKIQLNEQDIATTHIQRGQELIENSGQKDLLNFKTLIAGENFFQIKID